MKRLMFLISTEGKTTEQVTKQGWEAFQKYQAVEKQVKKQLQAQVQPTQQPVNSSTKGPNLEFNQKLEKLGILAPKPQEGLQVILHQTSPKYPQKSVPVDQSVQPVVPQPQQVPPVNTPRLSTEEYWKQFDTTSQHLGGVIQITNYPHPRKSQAVQPVVPQSIIVDSIKKK